MKKILFFITTVIFIFNCNGQIEEGKFSIEGSLNLTNSNTTSFGDFTNGTNKEFLFIIAPTIQKIVKNNLSIGGGISFQKLYSKSTSNSNDPSMGSSTSSSNNTSIGISLNSTKYYILSEKLYFTINGEIGIRRATTKDSPSFRSNYFGIAVGPGVDYFLNSSFALSSSFNLLNYYSVSAKDTDANFKGTANYFGLSLNQSSFFIGIKYFFVPKAKIEERDF